MRLSWIVGGVLAAAVGATAAAQETDQRWVSAGGDFSLDYRSLGWSSLEELNGAAEADTGNPLTVLPPGEANRSCHVNVQELPPLGLDQRDLNERTKLFTAPSSGGGLTPAQIELQDVRMLGEVAVYRYEAALQPHEYLSWYGLRLFARASSNGASLVMITCYAADADAEAIEEMRSFLNSLAVSPP